MHLYLIRHAESENNARPDHQRVDDPAITERGVQQANHLADWLATHPMDILVTSPFRRALQTAAPAALRGNTPVEVWCDIYERGGCYSGWQESEMRGALGLGHQEILRLIPKAELDAEIASDGWWGGRPRENDDEAELRAAAVRKKLENRFGDSQLQIAVITHAEFQRMLLGKLLAEQNIDVARLGPICNAGVTYLNFNSGHWQLQWLNAVTHIASPLITGAKG